MVDSAEFYFMKTQQLSPKTKANKLANASWAILFYNELIK